MRSLPFSFFAILYFVVTNIRCAEKSTISPSDFNSSDFTQNVPFSKFHNFSKNEVDLKLRHAIISGNELGKQCLDNVTGCFQKDKSYHQTSEKLLSFLSTTQPPIDFNLIYGVSRTCRRDSRKYLHDLKLFKLWALKMYDSTAKIPSGILNGNINQLGDFDMCLSTRSDELNIHGQYCLASIEIEVPNNPYLAALHKLVQSHYHFRSKLEDPGHRVPRFSSINWAVCVPNSCTSEDVSKWLHSSLKTLSEGTELKLRYEVKSSMCQSIKDHEPIPLSTILVVGLFIGVIAFEIFASVYDNFVLGKKNKWIISFSLQKNFKSLITINQPSGDIQAIHGIRMINALFLLLAHKSMAVLFLPYVNRTDAVEYLARPFSVLGRAASLYTDPFIMISGLLTSYSLIGKLDKTGQINILKEYVSRLYRIIPTFAALIAFCTFILPWLNNGPMWNLVVTHHADICKKYWWRNMLFIHNYFGFEHMCLTHTHHLGIDTELFFISPFMVYGLWKWPRKGSILLVILAGLSTVARYYVTYTMNLSNYVHFGTSVKQLFETANNMYILPPHRATVYIMGIFMGYLLRKCKDLALSKIQIRLGNTLALFSFLLSYLGPAFMGKIDYVYNPTDAAWYAAFSPILWVASFCWIIYTTQLGYKGLVGQFLSQRIWTLWTKISYTVYLTQFPVFFYNVGVTRSAHEFGFFTKMLNLQEYFWILLLSIALCVVFEMPFQNLRAHMLRKTDDNNSTQIRKKLT